MATKKKYPVEIQSFDSICNEGYLYVDKTALVYKMITADKWHFLCRSHRFEKPLHILTLTSQFEGLSHYHGRACFL